MQHSVADAKAYILGGIAACFGLSMLCMQPVLGATQIEVAVCSGTSSAATLTIDSPASDSVVNQTPLTVNGSVANVTQIDVSVDGVYNNTVAVAANSTNYSLQLQLAPGTHTIQLTGNDVCQVLDPVASVVVTYQPASQPSTGGQTPTTIGPNKPSAPSSEGGDMSDRFEFLSGIPILGQLPGFADKVGRAIDFDVTARDGLLRAMARFALFTLGLGLLLFGAVVAKYIRDRYRQDVEVEGYIQGSSPSSTSIMHHAVRNSWGARGLGLILLTGAFLI